MILNRQKDVSLDLRAARDFVGQLRKHLRLGRLDFNVCLVGDFEIARMNATYRGKARPTDVLSFPWQVNRKSATLIPPGARPASSRVQDRETPRAAARATRGTRRIPSSELANFLGDIVISAETARRNARAAGHS